MRHLLLLLFLPLASLAQDVNAIIKERIDNQETVGIVVGVYKDGKITYYTAGYADLSTKTPVTKETLFEIGSITKTFTTTVLSAMAQESKLALNDPAQKFLPQTVRVPERNGKVITLFDLATAHSGLPRMPENIKPADMNNPYIDYDEKLMFDFLSSHTLTRDIGSTYEYSNLGMGLLGVIVSRTNGKSYNETVRQYILKPLKMKNTTLMTPDFKSPKLATGYIDSTPTPHWTWNDQSSVAGAGGLISDVQDMMKYMLANLNPPKGKLGDAMRNAHQARSDASAGMKIGLGWHIRNDIVWHNGGTGGFRTFAGFNPKTNSVVVVLTNSTTGADDIGFNLLDNSIPLKKIRKAVNVNPDILKQYTGHYVMSETIGIDVTLEGNQVYIQLTSQPKVAIYAESEMDFFLKVVNAQIRFVRNNDGVVEQLILTQGGQQMPARKTQ